MAYKGAKHVPSPSWALSKPCTDFHFLYCDFQVYKISYFQLFADFIALENTMDYMLRNSMLYWLCVLISVITFYPCLWYHTPARPDTCP